MVVLGGAPVVEGSQEGSEGVKGGWIVKVVEVDGAVSGNSVSVVADDEVVGSVRVCVVEVDEDVDGVLPWVGADCGGWLI